MSRHICRCVINDSLHKVLKKSNVILFCQQILGKGVVKALKPRICHLSDFWISITLIGHFFLLRFYHVAQPM